MSGVTSHTKTESPKQRVLARHPKALVHNFGPARWVVTAPTMENSHEGTSAKVAWEIAAASLADEDRSGAGVTNE